MLKTLLLRLDRIEKSIPSKKTYKLPTVESMEKLSEDDLKFYVEILEEICQKHDIGINVSKIDLEKKVDLLSNLSAEYIPMDKLNRFFEIEQKLEWK